MAPINDGSVVALYVDGWPALAERRLGEGEAAELWQEVLAEFLAADSRTGTQ